MKAGLSQVVGSSLVPGTGNTKCEGDEGMKGVKWVKGTLEDLEEHARIEGWRLEAGGWGF